MKQHTKSTCKRALALCMSVLMLLTAWVFVAPTKAFAADVWDGSWDGSGFSNNHITSAKGFAQFINNAGTGTSYSGQTVYLDVDIDLNNIDFGNISGGKNVYYSRDNYFQGTFDGQGHTIANFRMHNSDHRVALFRSARNATFKNVTFTNVLIDDNNNEGKNGFAVMVGYGDGNLTFENIHVASGTVYGYNYVGGLVGEYGADNTLTLTNCSNGALIYADHDRAAGMVGHSKGRVVANGCSNTGEIYAGYSDAGGIAGWIEDDESSFVNCSNTGKVSTDACAGGIFGYFGSKTNDNKMTITGCSNTGEIISRGNGYCAGGIAGKLDTDATHSLENNVNRGSVSAKEDVGGIVGSNLGGGVWRNNKNYGNVYCDNDNAAGILGEVEDDKQEFYNCYNTGAIEGKNSTSGILGYGNAAAHTFSHCGNSGYIVSRSSSAGGIYAYGGNSQPVIEDCWNIGTVRAYNDAGGILGHTEHHSYIRRCWNAGSIETYDHNENGAHGGIVGQTSDLSGSSNDNPNMTDCFNWGPVSGGRDDGGLIGKIKDGRTAYYITNSYNAGQVTGTRPFAIIAYGGNVGNNVYYLSGVSMGDAQGTAISASDLRNSSGFSGNYCKNTWGVKIGSTTYYYPILNWYRNMFMFHLKFVDDPSGTNVYWDGEYNSAFYAPNPTRRGYTTDHWFLSTDAGKTIAIPTEIVTCGVTPCTDSLLMTQSFSEVTDVSNDSTFNLTWEKIKQKLDMNAVLNGEYKFDNINFFTADVYVNGVKVADDVNDFYQDLEFEDTYEITDIKAAEGYTFVGPFLGVHDGKQQSDLTGQMDLDLIEVAPEFRTLHTVTVTPGTGTTISGASNGTYAWGDTVTVTAAAQTGYDQSAPVLKVNGSVAASGSTITITGDTTITTENLTLNTYTVTWKNDDDSVIDTTTVEYGVVPTHADATKAATAEYTYTFAGWTPEVVAVTGDATYKATYTATKNSYTITWKNDDDSVIDTTTVEYGVVPTHADATKAATAEYTYTFAGWTPEVTAVTGNATYKATFTPVTRSYTVKFFDLDGETVLDTQSVAYGSAAEAPTLPEKAPDDTNHYSVTWDTAFDNITADTNVTAVAAPTPHNLSAAWTWADDASTASVVITCAGCDYSETKGVTPTVKSSTDATCTQDGTITYTATYAGFTAPDKTVVGEPAHHTLGSQVPAESSTKCTETGTVAYYECTVCHLTFSDAEGQNRITDLSDGAYGPHSFTAETANDDYFNSAATCTARATYFKSCAYCGLKGEGTFESGDFDYNNHSTTETVTRNAQEPGYTYKGYTGDKYCLACDHPVSTGEEIAKLDINANETYIAATGISSEAAADPDKYDANDIATLNAKLGELEAALAIDDNDEAVNAILGELATIVAGISELEYVTVTFTVDGETVKTERILSGGSATPPAQAELIRGEENHKRFSGWSGSYTNVTENVLITATYDTEAHNWLDGEVTLRPTCMATGTQAQSCVCGATNVKILPKDSANHTGNNTTTRENEVAPTCTAAGSYEEVVTCECGVVISRTDKTVSALGHNFGAWTQTAAPTCDTAGQESKTCDRCGATETRTVAALGHSWGDWTVTRQATCTAEGTKTRTCTRDASHTETIPIPKTAHHDGNGDNKCDVCGAAIDTGFRCSFCNTYEANRDKPIIGWFYIIVHFFIHLFAQMKAWV